MKTVIVFTRAAIVVPAAELPGEEIGARVEFYGIVRRTERGAAIGGLIYEAYEPMARRELEHILAELGAAHPCEETLFIHRLGPVPVGEASLYVRVLAAHRGEALALVAQLIDRLKQDVPIWKSGTF